MKRSFRGTHRAIIFAIIIIAAFLTFMFALIWSYHIGTESNVSSLLNPFVKYHVYFMISMGALGVAVGASVFYLMSQKMEHKEESAKKSAEVYLRFLTIEEQRIVLKIKEEKGKTLQSHLSREPGMNRLKVHRILSKLAQRGVVVIEGHGKTNTIYLQKDIYEFLP